MVKLEDKLSEQVVDEIKRMYVTDLHSVRDISRSFSELKISATGIKGGTNYISNIQPLCGSCNSSKHDKEIKY